MVFRRMILGAIALLSPFLVAGENIQAPDKPLRLGILLTDGSLIIGVPSSTSVKLTTSFAELDLPFERIGRIEFQGGSSWTVALRNGDKISGEMKTRLFELSTIFGAATVNTEHIKAIDCIAPVSLPAGLANSLILYYSFDADGGDKVADASGKDHNGIVHGAKWVANGKRGGAYEFNGSGDYIDTMLNISGGDEITACGWQFFTKPPADSAVITQFGEGSSEDVWNLFSGANGKGSCTHVANQQGTHYYFYGNNWELNKWKHLCMTYARGKSLVLYEDGVPVKSVPVADSPLRNNPRFTAKVAASQGAHGYWGIGLLDEIMVFDRALSAEEIKQLHHAQR